MHFKSKLKKPKNKSLTESKYEIESPHQDNLQLEIEKTPAVDKSKSKLELASEELFKQESINHEIKEVFTEFRLKNSKKKTKRSVFQVLSGAHIDYPSSNQRLSQFSSVRDLSISSILQRRFGKH